MWNTAGHTKYRSAEWELLTTLYTMWRLEVVKIEQVWSDLRDSRILCSEPFERALNVISDLFL